MLNRSGVGKMRNCGMQNAESKMRNGPCGKLPRNDVDVDVDVVDLRAQADASMPASNNNVIIIQYI